MKELLLHVGMPKTGSASIQNALADYDDGVTAYIDAGPINHSRFTETMFTSLEQLKKKKPLHVDDQNDLTKQRELLLTRFRASVSRDRKRFILSSEHLYHLNREATAAAIDFFKNHFAAVHVVGYVRAPRSYLQSAFQQRVKTGLSRLQLESLDYRSKLGKFFELEGIRSVTFRKFDTRLFPNGDVLQDFLTLFNGDPEQVALGESKNLSLSGEATALLFFMNRLLAPPLASKENFAQRQAILGRLHELGDKKLRLSEKLLVTRFRQDDLEWVRSKLNIDLSENESAGAIENERDMANLAAEALLRMT